MLLHYTFDTPVAQPTQCGHAIFSDFHVNNQTSTNAAIFPDECDFAALTPQERILEYMIWDLQSCVPPPPKVTCTPRTCAQENSGLRTRRRRMRQRHSVWSLRSSQVGWGRGRAGAMRFVASGRAVHPSHVRLAERRLRRHQRRVRSSPRLRRVRASPQLRRRRGGGAVRRTGRRRAMRTQDVRAAEHRMRPGRRWVRQSLELRLLRVVGFVRRSGGSRQVRSARQLHPGVLRGAAPRVRSGGGRLRGRHRLRSVRRSGGVRRGRLQPVRQPAPLVPGVRRAPVAARPTKHGKTERPPGP